LYNPNNKGKSYITLQETELGGFRSTLQLYVSNGLQTLYNKN